MKRAQFLLGLAVLLLSGSFLVAQNPGSAASTDVSAPPAQTAPEGAQGQPAAGHGEHAGMGHQLATESREAAGEEGREFKESASVQFVARHLGVSVLTAYWILIIINFAIVAGAIIWFWKSKAPTAFRNRTQSILKSMETARQASEEASRRLKDVEERLARLDSDIASMRASAETAAQQEESRIRAAAEEDKKKIIESAEQEIDAAARAARADLKNFAADLAVGLAEKQIRIDSATDEALVRGFGKELAESRNGKESR